MSVFHFIRHPDCAPGTWWWTPGEKGPTASCPKCQALHMISPPDHEIAPDGTVTPSLVCTRCGWHGTGGARLVDWTKEPS